VRRPVRLGGKVIGYYFAESADFDVVAVIDLPDHRRTSTAAAVATSALNWSTGMATSMRVT
jgi:hypothetical protein